MHARKLNDAVGLRGNIRQSRLAYRRKVAEDLRARRKRKESAFQQRQAEAPESQVDAIAEHAQQYPSATSFDHPFAIVPRHLQMVPAPDGSNRLVRRAPAPVRPEFDTVTHTRSFRVTARISEPQSESIGTMNRAHIRDLVAEDKRQREKLVLGRTRRRIARQNPPPTGLPSKTPPPGCKPKGSN